MARERPQAVILAAAKVGGILANSTYPADFLYDNLAIETNVIHAAHAIGAEKLLFLGSTCIYPKFAEQPIKEEALLTGALEPTNEWYAIAKIAGLKLAKSYRVQHGRDFISAMPTNLYGPNDNFDLANSHVLPALMRRIHDAKAAGSKVVTIWGTGTPRREFLHVDDLADAAVFLMEHYSDRLHINVGTGTDVSIAELAREIADVVGYKGEFRFRQLQAGWHPAEGDRHHTPAFIGLGAEDPTPRRSRKDLCVVPRPSLHLTGCLTTISFAAVSVASDAVAGAEKLD